MMFYYYYYFYRHVVCIREDVFRLSFAFLFSVYRLSVGTYAK